MASGPHHGGLRIVALLEGAKGVLVLVAGFGLLSLIHQDVQRIAEEIVRHFYINPASRYPRIFLQASAALTSQRLWLLASMALLYSALYLIEAWSGSRIFCSAASTSSHFRGEITAGTSSVAIRPPQTNLLNGKTTGRQTISKVVAGNGSVAA
jgi:hypothetical protein